MDLPQSVWDAPINFDLDTSRWPKGRIYLAIDAAMSTKNVNFDFSESWEYSIEFTEDFHALTDWTITNVIASPTFSRVAASISLWIKRSLPKIRLTIRTRCSVLGELQSVLSWRIGFQAVAELNLLEPSGHSDAEIAVDEGDDFVLVDF